MSLQIISKSAPSVPDAAAPAPEATAAAPAPAASPPPAAAHDDAAAGADAQGQGEPGHTATDVNIDPKTLNRLTTLSKAERAAREKAKTLEAELATTKARVTELEGLKTKADKLDHVSKLMDEDPVEAFRALDKDLDAAMAKFIATPPKSQAEQAAAAAVAEVKAKQAELEQRLADKEKAEGDTKTKAQQDAAAAGEAAKLEGVKTFVAEKLKGDTERWDIMAREATSDAAVVPEVIEAAKRIAIDRRNELGRALTAEESEAALEQALDAAEAHFAELGARYQRSNPRQERLSAKRGGLQLETLGQAETERHPTTIDGSLRGPLRGNPTPRRAMTANEAKAKALQKYGIRHR
jgi:hypothetical protein